MESSNKRRWEEEIYWQNFHFAHFSLTLPTNFHDGLTLPKKFTDHMRTKLHEQIVLKVNGVSWNVNLKKDKDDIMFHGDGWEEFVNAYSLKKADILVFKYNRRECFEVWLFDRASSCEKEASYFVRKVQQRNSEDEEEEDHNRSEKPKMNLNKGFTDDTSQEDYDSESDSPRNKRKKNPGSPSKSNYVRTARPKDDSDDQDESDETSDEENSISEEAKTTPKKAATARAREFPSNASCKLKRNADKKITCKGSRSSLYPVSYKSNRREITELEKANTLKKARVTSLQCNDSFIVVMRPTCVYKRFYLTVPSEWKPKSRYRRSQEVSLRVKEKTWQCRVSFSRNNIGFQGAGWKNFARDNFLEEFDVCVFVPSGSKNERFVLDVSIFRVVPEFVPTSLVTPP